tara:strand:+ start:375 stop:1061 length:687 start_codon:yes stop_codon:yes gene_type:complete
MSRTLIIGGSRGIGNNIVKEQLSLGKDCVSISRNASGIHDNLLQEFNVDVTSGELPDIDNINSLVYCPGSIILKPFSQISEDDYKNDFEINVLSAIRCIKKYITVIKSFENASIILFSTVAVNQGMPFHSSVSVAKAGVEGLSKTLAAEFAPKVRVNCIAPTLTKTDLASRILRNERIEENIANKHPLKRICEAEDISSMASFLISEKAKNITGQILRVDAGMSTLKI